jgi:hypothetical protein
VSPILESIGSVKGFGWGAAGLLPPSYESIATVNITGNTSTVNFNSIPSTFKHLQLRAICRTNRVSILSNICCAVALPNTFNKSKINNRST